MKGNAVRVPSGDHTAARAQRRGLTLLELILALSISAMILGAVAMAIQLHLRVLDTRRAHMEESQLARAILRRMADDLRSSVQQETTDFSGLAEAAASAASSGQSAATAALGGAAGGAAGDQNAGANQTGGNQTGGNQTGNNQTGGNQAGGNQAGGNQSGGNQTTGNQTGASPGGNQNPGGSGGASTGSASGGAGAAGGSSSGGATSGASGAMTGGVSRGSGSSASGASSEASEATEETEETESAPPPGVYGDGVQLRIDSSRLPRVEEFDAVANGSADAGNLPSDVKTITWYLASADGDSAASDSLGGSSTSGGLMRKEIDRAVSGYAEYAGAVDSDAGGELIAPEVTTLEYRYFDGSQWLTEWDMETQQALPMAVEIILGLSPLETIDGSASASEAGDENSREMRYRMVVQLPAARPAEATAESEDTATSDEAAP